MTTTVDENELRELGFSTAANNVSNDRVLARKLRIAFEHFRLVKPEHLARFNEELKARTLRAAGRNTWGEITEHDTLKFTPIANYDKVPPAAALEAIRHAKGMDCFDSFEVATIASVRTVPDPIVFGIVSGCENKYFVAQWDSDVAIEDILRQGEG